MRFFTLIFASILVAAVSAAKLQTLDLAAVSEWEGRIVGGNAAGTNQFPWQVSLQSTTSSHFCGAFIINNRWIGSAAHCTINRSPASTRARVGSNNRASGGVQHTIAQIRNHPSYNPNTLANDISTLQTSGTIGFNPSTQPIALASTHHGTVGAQVSGWGQTSHPGGSPDALRWKNTQTITNADCRSRHSAGNAQSVFDHSICTFTQHGQGTCMGDSGGPLVSGGQVIGAVSWGVACAQGVPDVFTRISALRPWLLQNS